MTKDEIKGEVKRLMPVYRAACAQLQATNREDGGAFWAVVHRLDAYGKALNAMGFPGTESIAAIMRKTPRPNGGKLTGDGKTQGTR